MDNVIEYKGRRCKDVKTSWKRIVRESGPSTTYEELAQHGWCKQAYREGSADAGRQRKMIEEVYGHHGPDYLADAIEALGCYIDLVVIIYREMSKVTFDFQVPTKSGPMPLALDAGSSMIFVGANGGGKTRLAAITSGLDIRKLAAYAEENIRQAIEKYDLPKLLAYFDDKGLLAIAASKLRNTGKKQFENWLTRVLRNGNAPKLIEALKPILLVIEAR